MRKKIEQAVQTSIMLPRTTIEAIRTAAIQRAYDEQREVHWTDVLREALAERFEVKEKI